MKLIISIGIQKKSVDAIVAKRYASTTQIRISVISTNNETMKFHLLCLEMSSSQRTLRKISARYSARISFPFTPLMSSSGKRMANTIASTRILKNQIFSYVVK